jgi:hypothetical protein
MIVVDRLLVSHHFKTFQKTVMQTALHAAVAHRGSRYMSHFEIVFLGIFLKRSCCLIERPTKEKKS